MTFSELFAGLAALLFLGAIPLSAESPLQIDTGQMTEVEDLSESLANTLLDLSAAARQKDLKTIGGFFSSHIETVWLQLHSLDFERKIKWVSHQTLDLSDSPSTILERPEHLGYWERFLNRFSEVEDVRFKVQHATFASDNGSHRSESQIKFFVIGRDQQARRLWVKGSGRLKARQVADRGWEISSLKFEQIELLRSELDLFSEVSAPAGVSISLPPYGTPGNDDFIYHGVAAGDLDGDGMVDVVATGVSGILLYHNRGDGRFRNVAWDWGLPPVSTVTAPLLLDYDNDGDLDIFLAAVGDQMLFENRLVPEKKPGFIDVSLPGGVAIPAVGFSVTAGDVNADGWPDIYVTSYNRYGRIMPDSWHRASNGTANLLFINQKGGSFKESAEQWRVRDRRWSYAAQFADLNGDGRQDLYVANDFGENALYVNRGDHFEDAAASSGVLDPGNGMGVSIGDYNNDGHLDLLVTNMSSTAGNRILGRFSPNSRPSENVLRKLASGNSLFEGKSDGSFRNVTDEMGPFPAGWAWGAVFVDFDNDGWQDIYSPNGFISGKSMKDT